jgi:branched-chain amino acid transport system permease protein
MASLKTACHALLKPWHILTGAKYFWPVFLMAGFIFCVAVDAYDFVDLYVQLILIYLGINIILTVSLNLVNGYMGEFSVGHAGFMAVGAYVASLLTVYVFPSGAGESIYFPLAILAGGVAAALIGFLVAIPSFKTRGDYLAIVTLAFCMIVKSLLENIETVGGPRGLLGMDKLTTLPWVFFWTALSLWVIRNLVYSNFGRGILSIREDEIASDLMSVNTRQVKIIAFVVSSFFAGIAGGLFAHALQFINPRMFDILKSTDVLIMVYLGGIASISGSILGAVIYTFLLEILRPLGVWRMVLMPLMLVLLMIFRPQGIMGMREARLFKPLRDLTTEKLRRQKKKEVPDAAP